MTRRLQISKSVFEMKCPQSVYTDLNGLWLLASYGEVGPFGGPPPFFWPQEGKKNRSHTAEKASHFPRGGARALRFTKYDTLLKIHC